MRARDGRDLAVREHGVAPASPAVRPDRPGARSSSQNGRQAGRQVARQDDRVRDVIRYFGKLAADDEPARGAASKTNFMAAKPTSTTTTTTDRSRNARRETTDRLESPPPTSTRPASIGKMSALQSDAVSSFFTATHPDRADSTVSLTPAHKPTSMPTSTAPSTSTSPSPMLTALGLGACRQTQHRRSRLFGATTPLSQPGPSQIPVVALFGRSLAPGCTITTSFSALASAADRLLSRPARFGSTVGLGSPATSLLPFWSSSTSSPSARTDSGLAVSVGVGIGLGLGLSLGVGGTDRSTRPGMFAAAAVAAATAAAASASFSRPSQVGGSRQPARPERRAAAPPGPARHGRVDGSAGPAGAIESDTAKLRPLLLTAVPGSSDWTGADRGAPSEGLFTKQPGRDRSQTATSSGRPSFGSSPADRPARERDSLCFPPPPAPALTSAVASASASAAPSCAQPCLCHQDRARDRLSPPVPSLSTETPQHSPVRPVQRPGPAATPSSTRVARLPIPVLGSNVKMSRPATIMWFPPSGAENRARRTASGSSSSDSPSDGSVSGTRPSSSCATSVNFAPCSSSSSTSSLDPIVTKNAQNTHFRLGKSPKPAVPLGLFLPASPAIPADERAPSELPPGVAPQTGSAGAGSAPSMSFLTQLAAQERTVLELREQLEKAETRLAVLKRAWVTDASRARRPQPRHHRPSASTPTVPIEATSRNAKLVSVSGLYDIPVESAAAVQQKRHSVAASRRSSVIATSRRQPGPGVRPLSLVTGPKTGRMSGFAGFSALGLDIPDTPAERNVRSTAEARQDALAALEGRVERTAVETTRPVMEPVVDLLVDSPIETGISSAFSVRPAGPVNAAGTASAAAVRRRASVAPLLSMSPPRTSQHGPISLPSSSSSSSGLMSTARGVRDSLWTLFEDIRGAVADDGQLTSGTDRSRSGSATRQRRLIDHSSTPVHGAGTPTPVRPTREPRDRARQSMYGTISLSPVRRNRDSSSSGPSRSSRSRDRHSKSVDLLLVDDEQDGLVGNKENGPSAIRHDVRRGLGVVVEEGW